MSSQEAMFLRWPDEMRALRTTIELAVYDQSRERLARCGERLSQTLSCWERLEVRMNEHQIEFLGHFSLRCRETMAASRVDADAISRTQRCVEHALGDLEPIGVPLLMQPALALYAGEIDINVVVQPITADL